MPLRAYLAGLALVFALAAGGAVMYGRVQAGDDARAAAEADARFAARLAARELGEGIQNLQTTVAGAAANPGIATAYAHPEDCGLSFGGTDAYTTGHVDLVRTDGSVACSSEKKALDRGYGAAEWLERGLREPILIAPAADPRTGKQVVLAAAPVPKLGLVLAVFNLDGAGRSLGQTYGGPRRLEFLLTDASGTTVLTRSIRPERWIGAKLAGTPFSAARDVDGTERLYAGATVPGPRWRVHAGADRAQALAATREANRRELTIILAGLLLFLAAAALVHRKVARPLARLGSEVRGATAEGAPQPVTVSGPTEVKALGRRLNELAVAVAREQANYRVLFDGSPLPMWVHDAQTRRLLAVNEAAVAAYGYSREELLALTVDALEHGEGVHARKDGTTLEVSVASHAIALPRPRRLRGDRRGRDREGAPAAPAPAVTAAGEPRPARRRRRPRLQQPAGRDPRLRVVHRAPRR